MGESSPVQRTAEDGWVRTETLPEGALFVSPQGVLYQVVMAGGAGFRKAEPWPWLPHGWSGDTERPNAVALSPGSLLARTYPLVAEGRLLPTVTRSDLTSPTGEPSHYVFPNESLAKLAAQLDEALARESGLAARKERRRWVLSDGRRVFRVYHYRRDFLGVETDLEARFVEEHIEALDCTQGPDYWQYIPAWQETLGGVTAHSTSVAETAGTQKEGGIPEPPTAQPARVLTTNIAPAPVTETAEDVPIPAPPQQTRRVPAMKTIPLSLDIGYGYTKGVGPDGLRFSFPSVIGAAEDIRFATDLIRGREEPPIQFGDARFFYGEQAVLQSRVQSAIFDRSRVHDATFKMLFVASLVEMARRFPDARRVNVVTGLPVDFFGDRNDVVQLFEGAYRITAERALELTVESVVVAPQPFGSLFRELLNDSGKIVNNSLEHGRIGVIDVGTYTTDFVVSDELRYVQRLSGSARIGWSKIISQVQQALGDLYQLELMPYEVDRAVQAGEVRVRGEPVAIESLIAPAVADVRTAIIARARDLWGAGADLDRVLVTGGGGPHLYDAIHEVYPHAVLLSDTFWANAEGFYRFGQRPATFPK